MRCKLSLLSGLVAAAVFLQAPFAAAGQPAVFRPTTADGPPSVERAQYWDIRRCRAWRRECAERWGWRSERWYRCLARHGCERHHYGDRWD